MGFLRTVGNGHLKPGVLRAHGWGLAAVGATVAIAFLQGAGGMPYFRDRLYYFLPQYEACRQAISGGELPLWNPFSNCGEPLLATWQVGAGSPFSLPFLFLPWAQAVRVFWCLVLPFAAAGTYALGLRAGLRPFGAAFAALVYATGAPLRTLGEWPNIVVSLAALPALLAACADLARGRRGATAAVALLFALQVLAGQPRQALIAALAAGLWVAAVATERRGPGEGARRFRLLVVAGALSLAVAAVQMLPTLELWAHSDRRAWGVPSSTVKESFLHLSDALTLLFARGWGSEYRILDPWRLLMPRLYFGWLGLWLAVAALPAARGPLRRFALLALPAGILVGCGGPYLDLAFRVLGRDEPALRYLGHFVLVGWPAAALLAGAGAGMLREASGSRGRIPFWLCAGSAGIAAAAWTPVGAWLAEAVSGGNAGAAAWWLRAIRADAAVSAAAVAAAAVALGSIAAVPGRALRLRGVLLIAIAAADLGWAAHAHEARAPDSAFAPPPVLARHRFRHERIFSPSWTVQVWDDSSPRTVLDHYTARWNLLSPNVPQVFGVHNAFGYEPLCLAETRELFGAFDNSLPPVMAGIGAAGVRWILGPVTFAPPGWRVRDRLAGEWGLMESTAAASPFRVVSRAFSTLPWRDLATGSDAGTASPARETWNSVALDVRAGEPALATASTPAYPGWRAFVNGSRARIVRAGGIFLSAAVPRGRSKVAFEYIPATFALGLFASSLALAALAAIAMSARPGAIRHR